MVEVPNELLCRHLIAEAREWGEYEIYDTVHLGKYGEYETEADWDLSDLSPKECDIEIDENEIRLFGHIPATYSIQVARSTRHHPAEYETEETEMLVSIIQHLGELSSPKVRVEIL